MAILQFYWDTSHVLGRIQLPAGETLVPYTSGVNLNPSITCHDHKRKMHGAWMLRETCRIILYQKRRRLHVARFRVCTLTRTSLQKATVAYVKD